KNNCVFPIRVCSHFIADIFVNTQILLKMTIKGSEKSVVNTSQNREKVKRVSLKIWIENF
ncbi:MAG: hypothetical protein KDK54_22470, partial [Leptospiraceae bacterium]|nr:hypothetical protein [Leptospiraceae bacterium]